MTSVNELEKAIKELSQDNFNTVEEYRLELIKATNNLQKKLAETAEKTHNTGIILTKIQKSLENYISSPEAIEEFKETFREFNDILDATFMRKELREIVGNSYSFLKKSKNTTGFYDNLVRNSTTLRKTKNACIQMSLVLDLVYTLQATEQEVFELSSKVSELEEENKEHKRQLNEIWFAYSSEDKKVDIVRKYKKLKEDGCTDSEVCKILNLTKPSLYKILKDSK